MTPPFISYAAADRLDWRDTVDAIRDGHLCPRAAMGDVFLGPPEGSALVHGAGTTRGIITLGEWDQTLSHVVIEGLTLEDGHWGIDAQHSRNIVIRHNTIRDVDYGVVNRRGDAQEGNQTVCDNDIEGRVVWPGTGIPSERGIDLRGDGNVVCHNHVRYFGDCVSLQPFTGPSYGNDVYGNDAAFCVDDGIEIDYNQSNVRVWRNRVMNARVGVSVFFSCSILNQVWGLIGCRLTISIPPAETLTICASRRISVG